MTEDHLSFLGCDLAVGARHKSERDHMMSERIEHPFKPFRRLKMWVGCVLELVLVAEVDDQFVDEGRQAPRRWVELCHGGNDYPASMTVP